MLASVFRKGNPLFSKNRKKTSFLQKTGSERDPNPLTGGVGGSKKPQKNPKIWQKTASEQPGNLGGRGLGGGKTAKTLFFFVKKPHLNATLPLSNREGVGKNRKKTEYPEFSSGPSDIFLNLSITLPVLSGANCDKDFSYF